MMPLAMLLGAGAAAAQGALPNDPAAAPPRPPILDQRPAARPPPPPAVVVPLVGLEALADGTWRASFAVGVDQPPLALQASLAELGRRLAARPDGRVTVLAQASEPTRDLSTARRLTLARAEAVKRALVIGGLDATRIDLRPLGRTAAALDVVDVVAPPGNAS